MSMAETFEGTLFVVPSIDRTQLVLAFKKEGNKSTQALRLVHGDQLTILDPITRSEIERDVKIADASASIYTNRLENVDDEAAKQWFSQHYPARLKRFATSTPR